MTLRQAQGGPSTRSASVGRAEGRTVGQFARVGLPSRLAPKKSRPWLSSARPGGCSLTLAKQFQSNSAYSRSQPKLMPMESSDIRRLAFPPPADGGIEFTPLMVFWKAWKYAKLSSFPLPRLQVAPVVAWLWTMPGARRLKNVCVFEKGTPEWLYPPRSVSFEFTWYSTPTLGAVMSCQPNPGPLFEPSKA